MCATSGADKAPSGRVLSACTDAYWEQRLIKVEMHYVPNRAADTMGPIIMERLHGVEDAEATI